MFSRRKPAWEENAKFAVVFEIEKGINMRPSKERIEKLRLYYSGDPDCEELVAEIDALTAERDDIQLAHDMGQDVLGKTLRERDTLREQVSKLTYDLSQSKINEESAEQELIAEQQECLNQHSKAGTLRERVGRLRGNLEAISTGCTGRDTDSCEYADVALAADDKWEKGEK